MGRDRAFQGVSGRGKTDKEEQAPGVLPRLSLKGHRGQEGAGWFSGILGLWADPTIMSPF